MTSHGSSDTALAKPEAASCCSPTMRHPRIGGAAPSLQSRASDDLDANVKSTLIQLKGGFFEMGARISKYADDMDSPPRRVAVSAFQLARFAVTNALFARFVMESGYVTTAEREGGSFVFHLLLDDPQAHINAPAGTPWWREVTGACWSAPEGPRSDISARGDHPVTHVSWEDAQAFCSFTHTRLPTEAEWEFAARGKHKRAKYPWGNTATPNGQHQHNVWQGAFPFENTVEDGFLGTAPVDAFAPNGIGLYNMTGNVWEWCADGFGPLPAARHPPLRDPLGSADDSRKVIRGGSYLCHPSYCDRFYVHSRSHNTVDSSTGNTGFRIAA